MDTERAGLLAAIDAHDAVLRRAMARSGPHPVLDSGLTMQQFRVLMLLAADGPLPHRDLAHTLGVVLATVTGLIDRLVARDLVTRTEDEHDRRIRLVALSTRGRALVDKLETTGQEMRTALLTKIDITALRGLEHGLAALRAVVEEHADPGAACGSGSAGSEPTTHGPLR